MIELENSAYFWQKIQALTLTSDFIVIHQKDEIYPYSTHLKCPCDFGILKAFENDEKDICYCFKGEGNEITSLVISVSLIERNINNYLLIGLSEEQEKQVLTILNSSQQEKTIVVRKGNEIPDWVKEE